MLKAYVIGVLLLMMMLLLGACAPARAPTEGPVVEEPVVEGPVVEEPVAKEPTVEEPVKEEPVVEEPVKEEPVVEEPVKEEPTPPPPKEKAVPPPPPPPAATGEVVRLYYYGPSALGTDPAGIPGAHNIYSATSSDGINFKEDPEARFSYDTKATFGITDPDVVRLDDGSWLMFLSLGNNLLKTTAPTSSGIFTRDESFSWNRGGVPGSHNFSGTVRTFVCSQGGINVATYEQNSGTLNHAGVALAPPTPGIIADPSVIRVGNEYLMFYKYAASHMVLPKEHEIYLATSADGIIWSQHAQNRFICQGSVPGAVYYNDTIYVYHCGRVHKWGGPPSDFGVAISRDNGATFTFSTMNIQGKTAPGAADPAAVVVTTNQP